VAAAKKNEPSMGGKMRENRWGGGKWSLFIPPKLVQRSRRQLLRHWKLEAVSCQLAFQAEGPPRSELELRQIPQ